LIKGRSEIFCFAEELEKFIQETKKGRKEDQTGLDPKTQEPFPGILIDEFGG